MLQKIRITLNNLNKLVNVINSLIRAADGNLRKFFKAIVYSFVNLIADLLSLGALFPLIYLILEKDSFLKNSLF